MAPESDHLDEIISRHHQIANLQVEFVDIEKYSQRRTLIQTNVIRRFTQCLESALQETSQEYAAYTQNNDIDFRDDIIKLPTGDGAAVAFSLMAFTTYT